MRKNTETAMPCGYYRLVESYRDVSGEVRKKTLLSIGFLSDLSGDELCLIQTRLNEKISGISTTLLVNLTALKFKITLNNFTRNLSIKRK